MENEVVSSSLVLLSEVMVGAVVPDRRDMVFHWLIDFPAII